MPLRASLTLSKSLGFSARTPNALKGANGNTYIMCVLKEVIHVEEPVIKQSLLLLMLWVELSPPNTLKSSHLAPMNGT